MKRFSAATSVCALVAGFAAVYIPVGTSVASAATPPPPAGGALDSSWGTAGIASVAVTGAKTLVAANRAVVASDGSVLVAGTQSGVGNSLFVAKLTPAGTLDSTFGTGGITKLSMGGAYTDSASIAMQPSTGDLIVGGSKPLGGTTQLALARLTKTGALDTTFGSKGYAVLPFFLNFSFRGTNSVAVSSTGAIDVVPQRADFGDAIVLLQFTPNGSLDSSFGSGGVTWIHTMEPTAVLNDLAYTRDGHIVVVGSSQPARTQTLVARFTASGKPDSTFPSAGSPGFENFDVSGSGQPNAGNAVRVDPSGNIMVSGTITNSSSKSTAFALRLTGTGARDSSFGSSGVQPGTYDGATGSATALDIDGLGRYLVAGGAAPTAAAFNSLGVERLTSGANPYDSSFGVGTTPGRESVACPTGTSGPTTSVAAAPSQKTIVAGSCNGVLEVARLNGGNISNLNMTTSTPNQAAGHGTIPLSSVPPSALLATAPNLIGAPGFGSPGFGSPGFGSPGFGSPGFGSPGFGSPGFGSPGFGSPVTQSVLTDPALGMIPLSAIPLVPITKGSPPPTWDSILAGTSLEGLPTQSVTLQQVFGLSPRPAGFASLTLGQLDLSNTALRKATLGAYMLGLTPISALAAPAGGWCSFLASQPDNCVTNSSGTSQSLLDLELGGDTLQGYYSAVTINLVGLTVTDSPLSFLPINDVDMSLSTLGATLTTRLHTPGSFLSCTPSASSTTCDNLLDAQKSGGLNPTATLEALLTDSPTAVGQLSLANLIGGLVPSQNLPIESVPLDSIIASSPMPASGAAYQVTFTMGCSVANSLVITPALPAGFRIIPSTASVTIGTAPSAQTFTTNVNNGAITPVLPPNYSCPGAQPVAVNFQAEPSTVLGPTTSGVTVSVSSDSLSVSNKAPVNVTKNFITTGSTQPANPANPATFDTLYLGHIASAGDLDYFSIPAPPAGAKLTLTLSHLSNDNDLVVYGPAQNELRATPGFGSPGFGSPGFGSPGFGSPGFGSPGFGSPGFGSPGFGSAVSNPTATFDDKGTGAPPTLDPDVPRLNLPLRGFSDNRGTSDESVTINVTSTDTTPFLVQVSGYNGSFSNQPYVLRVSEVAPPLAGATCNAQTFPYTGTAGQLPSTPLPAGTQTLILVNQQRLGALYGQVTLNGTTGDAGQLLVSRLQALARMPSVNGVVIPVDGSPTIAGDYTKWDASPCDVSLANQIVSDINALVDQLRTGLPNLTNIVLVGADPVIPLGRVQDYTTAFNEGQFTENAFGGVQNAESSAAANGYLLTDNPYGDLAPSPFLGSQLYVPQLAVGRLVETPAEIDGQIESFINTGGVTNPQSSFVTGYAPFDKGAQQVSQILSNDVGSATSSSQINETWNANDAVNGITSAAHGYVSVNAHYDIYRALPGNGDETNPLSTSLLPSSLAGGISFTIGCHSGLSIPDIYIANPTVAQKAQLLDWPQAELHNGVAGYAGNTGYGLGDTDVIAYSEKMNLLFAQNLGPNMTVGQAMSFAKQAYVSSVGVPSVYDAKAMEEDTFYGLPMWRIGPTGVQAPVTLPSPPPTQNHAAVHAASNGPSTLGTTTQDTTSTFQLNSSTTGRGSYYTVGNQPPQATPRQPIEPLTVVPLPTRTDGLVAHGALIEQLSSFDKSPFTPDYDTPVADSASFSPEPPVTGSFFPSQLQTVAGVDTPTGRQDNLILVPGQFFSSSSGSGPGIQRLYSDIQTTALYSSSDNYTPPQISTVTATIQGTVVQFVVTTASTNVQRGVVLMLISGGAQTQTWQHVELVNTGGGRWIGTASVPSGTTSVGQFFAQLADANGNVAVSSNKGQDFSASMPTGSSFSVSVSPPPDPHTGLYSSPTSVTLTPPPGSTSTTYTLDGGPATPLNGPITISGDGAHTLVATANPSGTTATYSFPIDANPPTVTITTPPQGATYAQGSTVASSVTCSSSVALDSCSFPPTVDTSSPGSHSFTATATDTFGRTTSATNTYTVASPPSVTFTETPPAKSPSTQASFGWVASGASGSPVTVTCTLNATPVTGNNCPQPGEGNFAFTTLTGLAPGSTYTFVVTAQDQWGGTAHASYTWYVDQPPTVVITSQPAATTDQTSATLTYTVSDPDDAVSSLTVNCTLNGSSIPCSQPDSSGNGSATISNLSPGTTYNFVVTVNDPAGATGQATATWTVAFHTALSFDPNTMSETTTAAAFLYVSGTSTPVSGQIVSFYAAASPTGSPLCSGTTDPNGFVSCDVGSAGAAAATSAGALTASFGGSAAYIGSSSTTTIFDDSSTEPGAPDLDPYSPFA